MPHQAGGLGLGADHDAGGIAQEQQRHVEGVAQLQEPRRLVGPVGVDGSRQVRRVVRHDAERPAFDLGERGQHSRREARPQLQYRPRVGQCPDDGPHVVHAAAVLGDDGAQLGLVGA